jgi:hypothetical protein
LLDNPDIVTAKHTIRFTRPNSTAPPADRLKLRCGMPMQSACLALHD